MAIQSKYFSPVYMARAARNRFWFWVARQLQFYLAHTHLIWGDASRVHIGQDVTLADAILNCRSGHIVVEDDVFFGHHVLVLAGTHDFHRKGRARQLAVPQSGHDIVIRRGAWIASNVVIIGPCEIGRHSVIVSGSVVRGDVAPGMIYAGNPARAIKPISFSV